MSKKRQRLAAVLRVARHREDQSTAAHHRRLREVEEAREMFIAAQHRAQPVGEHGSIDELRQQRARHEASARTALAVKQELAAKIERSIQERNQMLADMRYRRTVERIDDDHRKAWASLAARASERAMDDIAIAGWTRRNP